MRRDRYGCEGGGGLAVTAKGRDNTPKDTPARETALRLYAGRREIALSVLPSITTCTCWPPFLVPPLRTLDTGRSEPS